MIFERIEAYCNKNNMSIMRFEQMCGLANGTVGKWREDKLRPSLTSLDKIAAATGIPLTEWISENDASA